MPSLILKIEIITEYLKQSVSSIFYVFFYFCSYYLFIIFTCIKKNPDAFCFYFYALQFISFRFLLFQSILIQQVSSNILLLFVLIFSAVLTQKNRELSTGQTKDTRTKRSVLTLYRSSQTMSILLLYLLHFYAQYDMLFIKNPFYDKFFSQTFPPNFCFPIFFFRINCPQQMLTCTYAVIILNISEKC